MSALIILAIVAGSAIGIKAAIAWRKSGRVVNQQEPCDICAGYGCPDCRGDR